MADTWLLQLLDIGDLLLERRQARLREQCQLLAAQIGEQLRLCSLTRLPDVLVDQLQSLAQRFHIPCIALALLDEQEGWQPFTSTMPALDAQPVAQRSAPGHRSRRSGRLHPHHLNLAEHPRLQGTFGNTEGSRRALSRRSRRGRLVALCAITRPSTGPGRQRARLAAVCRRLAGPLLARLREHRHHLELERLESLQALLGTGWWEMFNDNEGAIGPSAWQRPAP